MLFVCHPTACNLLEKLLIARLKWLGILAVTNTNRQVTKLSNIFLGMYYVDIR